MNKYLYLFLFLLITNTITAQRISPCEVEIDKKAQKTYNKARKAAQKGENSKATRLYKEVIEIQDDWAAPYYQLGMQVVRKIEKEPNEIDNLYVKVLEYFEKVVQLCPEYNLAIYFQMGRIYYTIEMYEQAVVAFEKFLENTDRINPKDKETAEYLIPYAELYHNLYNNPVPFNPQPVPNVSTSDEEYLATISPDNDFLLFTRRSLVDVPQRYGGKTNKEFKEFFMISERQSDKNFDVGKPMPYPFNISKGEGSPTVTVDNKYLVYTKCEDIFIFDQQYYNCDLYYSEYINGEWTAGVNLGKNINRDDTWESQACISHDGQILLFTSDRPNGIDSIRNYDIYISTRDANGNWRPAQNIGRPINTPQNEKTPYLHSDNKTLYFSSTGHPGIGGYDIFISRLNENGKWSKPVNIGYPINSEEDDVGFFVSTLGDKAYFVTNRFSNNHDICEFELHEEARPNKVLLVKGKVDFEPDNAADIRMQIQNVDNKKIDAVNVDRNTGKYAFIISDTKHDYVLSAKQEGSVYDLQYIASKELISDGIREIKDKNIKLEAIEVGHSYKINDIYFETNSSELTEQSKNVIEVLLEFLNDNPSIHIQIQGHTDNIGQRKDNLILSDNRAKEV
ncbi:MAG: OmpA family protein, partial [Bacteroidales bacterium]|nr:OmpA family protein [Bacteroidales bacterium]